MKAAKVMAIISRLRGCAGQAESALTQVKMEDAPKSLKIPKSECPDIWICPPRHMAKIIVQYGRPSVSEICTIILWQDCYGKRNMRKSFVKHDWEKVSNWECFFVHCAKVLVFDHGRLWPDRHWPSSTLAKPTLAKPSSTCCEMCLCVCVFLCVCVCVCCVAWLVSWFRFGPCNRPSFPGTALPRDRPSPSGEGTKRAKFWALPPFEPPLLRSMGPPSPPTQHTQKNLNN